MMNCNRRGGEFCSFKERRYRKAAVILEADGGDILYIRGLIKVYTRLGEPPLPLTIGTFVLQNSIISKIGHNLEESELYAKKSMQSCS